MSTQGRFSKEKAEELSAKIMAFTSQTTTVIEAVAMGLSEEELHRRPAPNQWCMVEMVCHLADVDRLVVCGRVQALLKKDRTPLAAVNPDALAEEKHYRERTFAEAMAEFRSARQESIATIQKVKPEEWNRIGIHPRYGELSVGNQIVAWFFHDASHVRQLLNRRMHLIKEWIGGFEAVYTDDLKL